MAELRHLEFFLLRYVPDAVKEEFANIGLLMFEPGANGAGFAEVRFRRDWRRVRCVDPQADIEMLEALERDIQEQLRNTRDRALFLKRMEDSFSNVIQLSSAKACLTENPVKELATLASFYLETVTPQKKHVRTGRSRILDQMRQSFEQAGVWRFLMNGVPVSPYTKPGDPMKFDFGYRVGDEIKLFHAVSLRSSVEHAVMLASRYPKIAEGMTRLTRAQPWLTAVVEDDLDRRQEELQFALGALEESTIRVATVEQLPALADVARRELKV